MCIGIAVVLLLSNISQLVTMGIIFFMVYLALSTVIRKKLNENSKNYLSKIINEEIEEIFTLTSIIDTGMNIIQVKLAHIKDLLEK